MTTCADHVVGEVITDVEALDLPEFAELLEDTLVEVLEMLLDLARVDGLALGVHAGCDHVRALVHVGEEEGRRESCRRFSDLNRWRRPKLDQLVVLYTLHD
ncbi:hypothetical protein I3842_07G039600 [Carya illinoinensis]|uniref:Uncharacterized protein n=1 Tax=Carya illinoinensis TaxID=32201 RepID=A0A922EIE4_CARIL|nr:hypothetical protein I3842_07G039600 [Carya illinoinensis]